jgi:hypothetical protein
MRLNVQPSLRTITCFDGVLSVKATWTKPLARRTLINYSNANQKMGWIHTLNRGFIAGWARPSGRRIEPMKVSTTALAFAGAALLGGVMVGHRSVPGMVPDLRQIYGLLALVLGAFAVFRREALIKNSAFGWKVTGPIAVLIGLALLASGLLLLTTS